MLIFLPAQLVMLSVPKTGTTALEQALAPHAEISLQSAPNIKHATLRQYRAHVRPMLAGLTSRQVAQQFKTVAVIREPIDWLNSWYRYRTRDELIGHPNSTVRINFETFIEAWLLPQKERPPYAKLGTQSYSLVDQDNNVAVDYLFRYEAMPAFLGFLRARVKKPFKLKQTNVSPKIDTELSPALEKRLRERLADEYAIWEGALQTAP